MPRGYDCASASPDFANGAETGAFGYLFNQAMHGLTAQTQHQGAQPYPDALDLGIVIFRETPSLDVGDAAFDMREDIGYIILNRYDAGITGGVPDDTLPAWAQRAIAGGDEITKEAYIESQSAAQYVLQNPGADPTNGALYYRMGGPTGNPGSNYQFYGKAGPTWNFNPQGQVPAQAYLRYYGDK